MEKKTENQEESISSVGISETKKENPKRAKIIVRNISFKATEESLMKHFQQFGDITELNLLKRPNGKLVGCAFIQFSEVNQAAKAISQCTNKEFLGRKIVVDWAVPKDKYKQQHPTQTDKGIDNKEEKMEEGSDDQGNNPEKKEPVPSSRSKRVRSENEDDSEEMDNEHTRKKIKIEEKTKDSKKEMSNDVKDGCTVFLKNVPFDAKKDDVKKACQKFGPIIYAIVNVDSITGISKGTAFVKFREKASADNLLQHGDELVIMDSQVKPFPALATTDAKQRFRTSKNSILRDYRNLYLAKEGLIMAGSKSAEGVSAADMTKRHMLEKINTNLLKNSNRFISKTRLTISNLPLSYDNEKLKDLVFKFTNLKPLECRIMRLKNTSVKHPKGKSRGFGFMAFDNHRDALNVLRKMNNNPLVFEPNKRPIISFSIEDITLLKKKERRLLKSKQNNPTYQKKLNEKEEKNQNDDVDTEKKSKQVKAKPLQLEKSKMEEKEEEKEEEEGSGFVGFSVEPGEYVRSLESLNKRKKRKLEQLKEKHQTDKMKKKETSNDNDDDEEMLVNKHEATNMETNEPTPMTKSKWYVE